jgi:hypothetical protein
VNLRDTVRVPDQDQLTILDAANAVEVRTTRPFAGGLAALTTLVIMCTLWGLGFWGAVTALVTFWPLTLAGLALFQSQLF